MPCSGPRGAAGGKIARGGERLVAQHQHIAVQFAVECRDAFEIGLGQRDRRKAAVGDSAARLGDGQLGRVHRRPHALGWTKMCAGSAARSRGRRTERCMRSTGDRPGAIPRTAPGSASAPRARPASQSGRLKSAARPSQSPIRQLARSAPRGNSSAGRPWRWRRIGRFSATRREPVCAPRPAGRDRCRFRSPSPRA